MGTLLGACRAGTAVSGDYQSNFAAHGFFVTQLRCASNSTFTYRFGGDLLSDAATGTYRLRRDMLYLTYRPPPHPWPDSLLQRLGIEMPAPSNPAAVSRPARLLCKRRKLYGITAQGAVVRYAIGYSRIRRWLFWGERYAKLRHYYLQKRPNQPMKKK
jgi:hypothetical protein